MHPGRILPLARTPAALVLSLCWLALPGQAATVSYTTSGSDRLTHTAYTDSVQLVPFVAFNGTASSRRVAYDVLQLPRFNPALGTLDQVRIELAGTATTVHTRTGGCETLIFAIACAFSLDTDSTAHFGWNVPGISSGSPGPPVVNGVPTAPVSDFFATQSFGSLNTFVFINLVDANPPAYNGPRTLSANLLPSLDPAYVGTGTFNITTEILSAFTSKLTCSVSVLAMCQGGANVAHDFATTSARVTYTYTVTPVPAPASLLLLGTGLAGLLAYKRRRAVT